MTDRSAAWRAAAAVGGEAAAAARAEVLALRAAGQVQGPAEMAAGAQVLLGGTTFAELDAAQALALAAMARERRARALAAAAYDKLRWLRGEPQKFGTLWVTGAAGPEPWRVDPATTDSERAKWDVPPLAELLRRGPG